MRKVRVKTRIWSGWRAIVIKVFMACFAVYCICMTLFSTAMPEIRLPLFMGFIILAGFLNFPASKHHVRPNYLPWYDILLMLVGAACFFYFARNAMTMIRLATRIQPIHVVIGCIGILILSSFAAAAWVCRSLWSPGFWSSTRSIIS